MYSFEVLIIIVLSVLGFGCVVLLGAFLPRQLDDDEDEEDKKNT